MFANAFDSEFARDVRAGLTNTEQKTLPCRYLYDDVGSALFEAITCLDEYGLTRADARILTAHARHLVDLLPPDIVTVELGSGSGAKTRPILEQLRRRRAVTYYPIDLSTASLTQCVQDLGTLADVVPIEASYLDGLRYAAAHRAPNQTLLVLFLGSTIGNFEPGDAINFLRAVRAVLRPGDALLLGTDLVKPVDRMIAAYDDAAGVTAAFNLNLLARINRELEADFNLRQFEHVARYDPEAQRIEMHLRSRQPQTVAISAANLIVDFVRNETICTEVCHKFLPDQLCTLARTTNFRLQAQWVDEAWPFAESLFVAV
jgi:dimethylhistidine N-methyltransferase